MVKVYIIESERGWGQRVDEIKEFESHAAAETFVRNYNREHCPPKSHTPDWYMFARIEGSQKVLR